MDVTTSIPKATKTTSSTFAYNPDSELKSEDFMKLFLTELQYQDPTSPMENKDMLQQTSMLTQLQTNQDLSDTLQSLSSKMMLSTQFNSVNMIGKTADTGLNSLQIDENSAQTIPFNLYFDKDFKEATIKIEDVNGNIVKSFTIKGDKKGIKNFSWDRKDDKGNFVENGLYSIKAEYKTTNLESKTTKLGVYPVESVKFENNQTYVKLNNSYLELSAIKEVF